MCWVSSGFFLEAPASSKNDWGQEMNNRRDEFMFSGKGNPQNVLVQQTVLKYRITFLCISTLLKYIISIKQHHLHFYINITCSWIYLWNIQHWGKCQSTEQMLKAVRGLYGDYIEEYRYILSSNSISWCVSISLWALRHLQSSGHRAWRETELGDEAAPIQPAPTVPVNKKLHLKPFKEVEKQISALPVTATSQEPISSAS